MYGMQESYEMYGKEGVAVQLLYIANNLKRVEGSGIVRKELKKWNAKLS
jgi:transcriptional/translational regulatory protein YebC/TACO1